MGLQLIVLALLSISTSYVASNNVFCYHGTWSVYRTGNGNFTVDNIDPFLCTHIFYAFAGISAENGSVIALDTALDLEKDNYRKFTALKEQNPALKTLLSVGGWSEGSEKYSTMAGNETLRATFVSSAVTFLETYGFDGFDLDWEYPARRDTAHGTEDIDNFSTVLKELKAALEPKGYLLSAAVSAVESAASLSYDIPTICEYLDYVNIMTYDLYGAWDSVTGHNAGLHKGEGDEALNRTEVNTVDVAVEYWLAQGCPAEKIALGTPFYGHTFILTNATENGVRAPSSGYGIAGPYTGEAGFMGYNEFCEMQLDVTNGTWEVRQDNLAEVPYAFLDTNWFSFDDATSLTKKVQYALQMNITNIMIWSIETDDFHGICGEKNPLLKAINAAFNSSTSAGLKPSPENGKNCP